MAINSAGQTLLQTTSSGITLYASGSDTYDATAITTTDYTQITCGFIPRWIIWENITDRTRLEWYDGMAQDSALKTIAAGTRTLEVTGGNHGFVVGGVAAASGSPANVTPNAGQFQVSQNATLAGILASKVIRWQAFG